MYKKKYLFIVLSIFLFLSLVKGEIYFYKDKSGKIFLTNVPDDPRVKLLIISKGIKKGLFSEKDIDKWIEIYSTKYKIDKFLIKAIIETESNYNAKAVSKKGAKGLMQLMPAVAKEFNVKDPFDIKENIKAGILYFKKMLTEFNGNVALALAAYNSGINNVKKYDGIPPFKETQEYVKKVMTKWKQLSENNSEITVYKDKSGNYHLTNIK